MLAKTRRTGLWTLLLLLIGVLLGTLVWLVGRYEQSRFEDQLELSAINLANDIRAKLTRNAQLMLPLTEGVAPHWEGLAAQLLNQQPEILRLEKRNSALKIEASSNSPFLNHMSQQGVFEHLGRQNFLTEVAQACALATRSLEPAYSMSYFVPSGEGTGVEVTDMCLPHIKNGKAIGYVVATYSLVRILNEWGAANLKQKEEISFRETEGSRVAVAGNGLHPGQKFSAQTVLNLQGIALVLHLASWRSAPYWLANTPTALALALVLALIGVLALLYRDTRKRIRTEAKLAREIIQQRKSEEVSRQSLERLQKSARLATLGEMASMLSHELNQPLAAIASYASGSLNLLANDAQAQPRPEDVLELKIALERIASQSARAGQVIKSVHGFVRRRETERGYATAQGLLDEVRPLLELQAKQMGVRLDILIADSLPSIWCDQTLIEQVIINLARNGMQAMSMHTMGTQSPSGRRMGLTHASRRILTISALASHSQGVEYVEFRIQDHGPGLTDDVSDKLFTPFFTTKMEGMGLGLSLCRTVIEQHGSSLTYTTQTTPPLTGTTFSFKLTTTHAALA